MINISQKFDSNQTQKCRFIDVNIQKLEVYRNLYVQSSCKLLFVQGSWWLFAPSCLDAQAGKPQGSKMLAIKNRHSLLPGTGNVHNQIPLIPNLPAKHDEFTLKERTSNPLSHLAIWTMIDHSPTSQSLCCGDSAFFVASRQFYVPCLPPMTGNGKHTTYVFMVIFLGGGFFMALFYPH